MKRYIYIYIYIYIGCNTINYIPIPKEIKNGSVGIPALVLEGNIEEVFSSANNSQQKNRTEENTTTKTPQLPPPNP